MFVVHIYASPFVLISIMISLSVWLCVCRWGFGYNLKDREVIRITQCLVVYFVIITLLNVIFLGHMGIARHVHQFASRTIFVQNNDVEKACRVLNRILSNEDIFGQFRRTRYYEKPTYVRRRVNFETCKSIYNEDMSRKIKFLLRKNRVDPFPGAS